MSPNQDNLCCNIVADLSSPFVYSAFGFYGSSLESLLPSDLLLTSSRLQLVSAPLEPLSAGSYTTRRGLSLEETREVFSDSFGIKKADKLRKEKEQALRQLRGTA